MMKSLLDPKYSKSLEMIDTAKMEEGYFSLATKIQSSLKHLLDAAIKDVLKSFCPSCGLPVKRGAIFSQPSRGREWMRVWCDVGHSWDSQVVEWYIDCESAPQPMSWGVD